MTRLFHPKKDFHRHSLRCHSQDSSSFFTVDRPPQSPDLNPVEHLWDGQEKTLLSGQIYATLDGNKTCDIAEVLSNQCHSEFVSKSKLKVVQRSISVGPFFGQAVYFSVKSSETSVDLTEKKNPCFCGPFMFLLPLCAC